MAKKPKTDVAKMPESPDLFQQATDLLLKGTFGDLNCPVKALEQLWLQKPLPILKAAREVNGGLLVKERQALQVLVGANVCARMAKYLNMKFESELSAASPEVEALQHLVRGAVYGVLAADAVVRRDDEAFAKAASDCLAAYQSAWPLSPPASSKISARSNTHTATELSQLPQAEQILHRLESKLPSTSDWNPTNWFVLRRILSYVLGEDDPQPSFSNQPRFLAKVGNGGVANPVVIERREEGVCGFYLDPVDTGLLHLDPDMVRSLNLAWRVCQNNLTQRTKGFDVPPGLRLAPHTELLSLTGDSAGGLFAVAMLATAQGIEIDTDASVSFAIQLKRGVADDGHSPLGPDDITIGTVAERSIGPKFKGAAKEGMDLSRIGVHFDQSAIVGQDSFSYDKWSPTSFGTPKLSRFAITSLADALRQMTGNAKKEQILQEYCRFCRMKWESGPANDNKPGPTRDFPQPVRFIEPHFSLPRDGEWRDQSEQAIRRGTEDKKADPGDDWPLSADERSGITLRPGHQEQVGNDELTRLMQFAADDAKADWLSTSAQSRGRELVQIVAAEAERREPAASSLFRGARLILAEDANAGKTVFTHRLKYYFASEAGQAAFFDYKPVLVFRWENTGDTEQWPVGDDAHQAAHRLRLDLQLAVAPFCGELETPEKVVDYALGQGRAVLIFDAADQAARPAELINALQTDLELQRCHVIVTGRSFRFRQDDGPKIFSYNHWTRVTIRGFDDNQKARYLDDLLPDPLRSRRADPLVVDNAFQSLFEGYGDVAELLEVPGMIRMARELIEQERQRVGNQFVKLTRLQTRCDFYWEYYRKLLAVAVAERNPDLNVAAHGERWQMMLAVTAFRMVLERMTNYSAQDQLLTAIKTDVIHYCKKLKPDLEWTGADQPEQHWTWLAKFSALSDHSITEPHRQHNVLSWRHKGWMEFFLALFLAKYADAEALLAFDFSNLRPDIPEDLLPKPGFQQVVANQQAERQRSSEEIFQDVLTQITNDPQWYWGWRMATEIPRVPVDAGDRAPWLNPNLGNSLATLLLPPARGLRPTELMYYAFYLFEQDELTPQPLRKFKNKLTGTTEALQAFRWALTRLLEPPADPSTQEESQQRTVAQNLVASFRPCPPQEWVAKFEKRKAKLSGDALWEADPCVFWQGSPEEVGHYDERPQHRVRVQPFMMQQTTVTRAQYRLFDSRLEASDELASWGGVISQQITYFSGDDYMRKIAGDDCPILMVHWFDAYAFAKFLGPDYRLPTEAEWEYACRAGKDGPGDLFYFGKTLTKKQANFENRRTKPLGHYPLNAFQLNQMHGNVWEWSADWFDPNYYREVSSENPDQPNAAPLGPGAGSSRVLRGGSFNRGTGACRSAFRDHLGPGSRYSHVGFRVVCVGLSERPSRPLE